MPSTSQPRKSKPSLGRGLVLCGVSWLADGDDDGGLVFMMLVPRFGFDFDFDIDIDIGLFRFWLCEIVREMGVWCAAESKIKSYEVEVSSLKLEIREMSEKLEVINAKAQSLEREGRMMEQEKLHLEEKYRSEFERFDEVHERCKIAERDAKRSNEVAEKERAEATAARRAKRSWQWKDWL
ncbi:hypothetical protein Q3G72_025159 [Acer saccharum]|nr:hypothetical protein Q3G72_025159 [Acer saccharum]